MQRRSYLTLLQQDILTSVPSSLALVILDTLLSTLTHTSPSRRRLALVAFFGTIFLSIHFTISIRAALAHPSAVLPSSKSSSTSYDLEDAAALAYVPAPPTAAQNQAYEDLLSLIVSRKSAYPGHVFQEKALRTSSTKVVGVTAVLLHWKRKKGLDLVLKHITRYPYIREVIIWNNRPGVDLKSSVGVPWPARRSLPTNPPSPRRTSPLSHHHQGRISPLPNSASSTHPPTFTTLASTSPAQWPRRIIATSTTTTGSTFTWTRCTPSTWSAAREAAAMVVASSAIPCPSSTSSIGDGASRTPVSLLVFVR